MIKLEKRNAAPAGTGNRVECLTGKVNTDDTTEIWTAPQRRAAARLAAQFGLTLSVALTVAALAGLGEGRSG